MGRPTSISNGVTQTVEKLKSYGAKCDGCPFFSKNEFRPVLPVVPNKPYGVVIGEAPGKDDCQQGIPFIGATGEALNEELTEAGLLRAKLVLIHAICCLPTNKNISIMGRAFHACHGVFLHFMKTIDPQLPVLTMGSWASAAFSGKRVAVERTRGFIRYVNLQTEITSIKDDSPKGAEDEAL